MMQKLLDAKISSKRNNNVTNYANLAIELKELCNVCSMKTVPIIIGPCGLIHKKFKKLICKKLDIKINAERDPTHDFIRRCKYF